MLLRHCVIWHCFRWWRPKFAGERWSLKRMSLGVEHIFVKGDVFWIIESQKSVEY